MHPYHVDARVTRCTDRSAVVQQGASFGVHVTGFLPRDLVRSLRAAAPTLMAKLVNHQIVIGRVSLYPQSAGHSPTDRIYYQPDLPLRYRTRKVMYRCGEGS